MSLSIVQRIIYIIILLPGGQCILNTEEVLPPYVNCHPSKALLGRCFLASFKEKEEHYKFCMQQLLANECIILDESLGVGARIGIPGAWGNAIKMFPDEYHGMFLVFNEAKHILSWCFLKESRFHEVSSSFIKTENTRKIHKQLLYSLQNAYLYPTFVFCIRLFIHYYCSKVNLNLTWLLGEK